MRQRQSSYDSEEELAQIAPIKATKSKAPDLLWTRVIRLFGDNHEEPGVHSVKEDLSNDIDYWQEREEEENEEVKCYFDPTPYKPRSVEMRLEDHQLTADQLLEYAHRIINIRKDATIKGIALNEAI